MNGGGKVAVRDPVSGVVLHEAQIATRPRQGAPNLVPQAVKISCNRHVKDKEKYDISLMEVAADSTELCLTLQATATAADKRFEKFLQQSTVFVSKSGDLPNEEVVDGLEARVVFVAAYSQVKLYFPIDSFLSAGSYHFIYSGNSSEAGVLLFELNSETPTLESLAEACCIRQTTPTRGQEGEESHEEERGVQEAQSAGGICPMLYSVQAALEPVVVVAQANILQESFGLDERTFASGFLSSTGPLKASSNLIVLLSPETAQALLTGLELDAKKGSISKKDISSKLGSALAEATKDRDSGSTSLLRVEFPLPGLCSLLQSMVVSAEIEIEPETKDILQELHEQVFRSRHSLTGTLY